ncbi:MAG: hypothetical protein FJZ96_09490 [Chloroflexi bacterium]|nr:hypothetical protein [Chloroflexota bacterium]
MSALQTQIRKRLHEARRVLVTSHVRPDGDAIGSLLALGLGLANLGKEVQLVLSDGLPASFKHLPGSDLIREKSEGDFDLVVTVDCSDLKRAGPALGGRKPDLVIDHHATNEAFGNLNLIEPEAVATASALMRHMPAWGMVITPQMAAGLLTGLITDTLGFRTPNTTPECLRQAADLLETGAEMHDLYYRSMIRRTFPAARYWGAGLSSLQKADGIIWATLTLEARRDSGYGGNDDADLINIVSAIEGSDVTLMFVEQKNGSVKVSWRASNPQVDVSQVALQFGGGGHKAAAGAEVDGGLAEVQERILDATRRVIKGQTGIP